MTVYYLSGPMRSKPHHNREQFAEVEAALSNIILAADTIFNPSRNFKGDQTLEPNAYMVVDLKQVLEADVIVLLPDWRTSEGARREVQLGIWTGKQFLEAKPNTGGLDWLFTSADITDPNESASLRLQVVQKSGLLITGDRNNTYGPPHQDFRRSSDAMTAYGYRHTQLAYKEPTCPTCGAKPLESHDTAILVDCIKTSRIMWSPAKEDHWVDKCGYAGCGYECAVLDEQERLAV